MLDTAGNGCQVSSECGPRAQSGPGLCWWNFWIALDEHVGAPTPAPWAGLAVDASHGTLGSRCLRRCARIACSARYCRPRTFGSVLSGSGPRKDTRLGVGAPKEHTTLPRKPNAAKSEAPAEAP